MNYIAIFTSEKNAYFAKCPVCKHRTLVKAYGAHKRPYSVSQKCWFCRSTFFKVCFVDDKD